MTKRETRRFIESVSPSPGFILDLTKSELSDLVYDLTNIELEDYEQNGTSNAKRLTTLLEQVDNQTADTITSAILTRKDNNES